MKKKRFYITTTAARTLKFFTGQPRIWKQNFDVCAIAGEKERLIAFANEEGIGYRYIPMRREISFLSDCICLFRFIWLFLTERPYVVHGNTPKASLLSMLAAWMTRRPVRIYMCHGLRYQTAQGKLLKILKSMEWISCHCATKVIGVSKGVVEQLVKDGLCPKDKACIVGFGTAGGIDTDQFSRDAIQDIPDVRKDLGIPTEAFVFCFIGRIVKDKGINELVSAFVRLMSENSKTYLLLIGSQEDENDPIGPETQRLIDTNTQIMALGRKNDVRPYLRTSNAVVLPSYREGVGQVLLEANAMGVPCIASDIIGPRDVIEQGKNGELIEAQNADDLYRKMADWVNAPERVKDMADNCRNYILERFSSKSVNEAYYNEYRRMSGVGI